mgnify:CR=1 FL=1
MEYLRLVNLSVHWGIVQIITVPMKPGKQNRRFTLLIHTVVTISTQSLPIVKNSNQLYFHSEVNYIPIIHINTLITFKTSYNLAKHLIMRTA